MKHLRKTASLLLCIASLQILTSCFGKFALVKMLYKFNNEIAGNDMGGKFVKSIVFIVLFIIPVYEVVAFVDWIIINVIEFWSGTNPIAMKEGESETQFVSYGGREFQLTATKNKMAILELSGRNKGKETILHFSSENKSISISNNGKLIKVADYKTDQNFASGDNLIFQVAKM